MQSVLWSQVNISGVINANTSVVGVSQPNCSDCDPNCKDTIAVSNATAFQKGDRALIIQMKGATINTANTAAGGAITAIANAGNYEFFFVDSVSLSGDLIFPKYGLIKSYDAAGQTQVIRIPNYGNSTVTVTGTLTAPTWTEASGVGGVVALVAKKLILNADINVVGSGFKGVQMTTNGTPDNCTINPTTAFTLSSAANQSFTKGEGIVSNNTSFNRGRAPRANGGGSGISGDSGGGGGSSYGAGGIGGRRWCEFTVAAGGLGGVSLASYFPEDKLFLGGAGGAGFVTTGNPSTSTDGGGIIILFVDTLVGNGYSILADGTSPGAVVPSGAPDGGGGGGGGGSVLLNVLDIQGNLTVSSDGGDGQDLNTTTLHGPGGGGGGGVLLYSLPTLPGTVTFGAVGGIGGQHSNANRNGSGDGSDGGTFGLYVPIENVNYRANIDEDLVPGVCDIDDDNDGIPDIQEIYSGDHDNDGVIDYADADFCLDYFDGVNSWDCATDGLPNPTADMDGDGYANFIDADFPYCGTFTLGVDKICSNFDADRDGAPNHLDLDSDNDGIPDIIEAGGVDTNGNGQSDNSTDTDGDGLVDLYDNDNTDGPTGSSPCSPQPGCLDINSFTIQPVYDSDNDTIPDFLDRDSDNDGIPDVVEAGGADENGDGRIDNFGDADEDGMTDQFDASICEEEVTYTYAYGTHVGASSTGITNGNNSTGAPNNTFAQVYDTGDRLVLDLGQVYPISTEYQLRWRRRASGTGYTTTGPIADMRVEESADNATYAFNSVNPQDATRVFTTTNMYMESPTRYLRLRQLTGTDDDFDFDAVTVVTSVLDTICFSGIPLILTGPDGNADDLPDYYVNGDFDGDEVLNFRDLDSDNDGIPDLVEVGGTDTNGDGSVDDPSDTDEDGIADIYDGDPADVLVLGDDGPGSNSANALLLTGTDANNDGLPDSYPSDVDADQDGNLNLYDLDSDNDGITDVREVGGTDANNDGFVDGNATDTDNDGFTDSVDGDVGNDGTTENTASALLVTGADTDADGAPNSYPNHDLDDDLITNPYDLDSDGDGIIDNIEAQATTGAPIQAGAADTDEDGIANVFETGGLVPVDTDGDGDPDYLDTDSDDDLYPDLLEAYDTDGNFILNTLPSGNDTDGDGLDNNYDLVNGANPTTNASNNGQTANSFPNVTTAPSAERDWREVNDHDDDGIQDFLDLDDDNDGIPDLSENGNNASMGDEDGDGFPNWIDVVDDGNGGDASTTNYTDADGNGIPDVYDRDGDGVPNHFDLDADNDGITDLREGGLSAATLATLDANSDGMLDASLNFGTNGLANDLETSADNGILTYSLVDTDGDGVLDYRDLDSDNDGITDRAESGVGTDANNNGVVDGTADADFDGILDSADGDDANLGSPSTIPLDSDGDGIPNFRDLDSDNDGITDRAESGVGTDSNNNGIVDGSADADGDGILDSADSNDGAYGSPNSSPTNTDGNGPANFIDLDSDNDGILDLTESGTGTDSNNDGVVDGASDADGDGILDSADSDDGARGTPNNIPTNTDGNGPANFMDLDSDNDGITDRAESGVGTDSDNNGVLNGSADADGDGILDSGDSDDAALGSPNTVPTNTDGNGPANYLDLDSDNDGITDLAESGFGTDSDNDGIVDGSSDADSDGILDSADSNDGAFGTPNTIPTNTDIGGQPNYRDLDSDNDGITDFAESGIGTDSDNNGVVDGTSDADGDGILDSSDSNDGVRGSAGSSPTNTDGNGPANFMDLDSDNDGITDHAESGAGNDADNDGDVDGGSDADGDGILNSADTDDAAYGSPGLIPTNSDNSGGANFIDIDSDNDGITDFEENIDGIGTDSNNDGVIDGTTDTDGDGILDSGDSDDALYGSPGSIPTDSDGDGLANSFDIDSDADGIIDNIEAQATTATPTQAGGTDADSDGLDNNFETNGLSPVDTDGDGTPDYLDADSDDDGFSDLLEGWDTDGNYVPNTTPAGTDTDGDGLDNNFDDIAGPNGTTNPSNNGQTSSDFPDVTTAGQTTERDWREVNDRDGDGVSDQVDRDDDNDGMSDISEAGGNAPDGDEDGDSVPNWLDTTDDGNGGDASTTSYVDANSDGIPDVYDFDQDGIPNHLDKDSDNDGLTDNLEVGGTDANEDGEVDYVTPGDPTTMTDADGDGWFDTYDNVGGAVTNGTPLTPPNTDGAGGANHLDIDSDDDGITDNTEAQPTVGYLAPSNTDTDADGIDDSYDPDNSGTFLAPVNTEGTGSVDYLDSDSDDDGVSDAIEGHDSDGDGVADAGSPANTGVSGGGTDTDGDGLLDGFDNNTASRDPTNGGLSPNDHPNYAGGGVERDWREIACAGGTVVLAPNNATSVASEFCTLVTGWTYYYNPADSTELLFGIEHKPSGGNTNDFTAQVSLTVSSNPQTAAGVYSAVNLGTEQATFVMGRYWNIGLTSGSLNGPVNIRFFYNPIDADTMQAVAEQWKAANADTSAVESGRRWFRMNSGTFDPGSADLQFNGIQNSTEIFTASTGTIDGIDYAQFDGLTVITGGSMAYTIGVNSVILPIELLAFQVAARPEKTALLTWVTATEINSDRFDVERSSDAQNWTKIADTLAAGFSNVEVVYVMKDAEALIGQSYYRLKLWDNDGSFVYSQVRQVNFESKGIYPASAVYPNPNRGQFILLLGNTDIENDVAIYNSLGQLVERWSVIANSTSFNIQGLSAGTYMLRVTNAIDAETFRIIVQ